MLGQKDETSLNRFAREVRLCCQLTHPNTIVVYDYGRTDDGTFYYAMEHLEGCDLHKLVAHCGPQPAARVLHILLQACGSLAEAHAARMLHRDIKPANLFLTERGGMKDFVKLLDFGLAKNLDPNSNLSNVSLPSVGNAFCGTPSYMAPEVVMSSGDIDGRADLFALALVGYYLLTGTEPFSRETVMATLMATKEAQPPLPSDLNPEVPKDLEGALMRCLSKDRNHRPPIAEAFAADLHACADATSWTQREARVWWMENTPKLAQWFRRRPKRPSGLEKRLQ